MERIDTSVGGVGGSGVSIGEQGDTAVAEGKTIVMRQTWSDVVAEVTGLESQVFRNDYRVSVKKAEAAKSEHACDSLLESFLSF